MTRDFLFQSLFVIHLLGMTGAVLWILINSKAQASGNQHRPIHTTPSTQAAKDQAKLRYAPRQPVETSGFLAVFGSIEPWRPDASLEEYAAAYERAVPRGLAFMDKCLETGTHPMVHRPGES